MCIRDRGNYDLVTNFEVVSAADNAVHIRAAIRGGSAFRCHTNLAPVNGLAVLLRLGDAFEHLTDNDRTAQLTAVDRFVFQPDANKRIQYILRGRIFGNRYVLTQP